MGLKYYNSSGEIVLASKINLVKHFFLIVKIAFRNESNKLFFQEEAQVAPQNKIVHNFHITNPNRMNQSLLYINKITIYKKQILNKF